MRPLLAFTMFLMTVEFCPAQTVDRIIIKDESWSFADFYKYEYLIVREKGKFILYQTNRHERENGKERKNSKKRRIKNISDENIQELLKSLTEKGFETLKVENFGINQAWIDINKSSQLESIRDQSRQWTPIQNEYVLKQLSGLENYERAIKRYVGREGYYIIAQDAGADFGITVYFEDNKTLEVIANEKPYGMPWAINEQASYNSQIPKIASKILPKNNSFNKDRFNAFDALPIALAQQIYDDKCAAEMKRLAALEFKDELNELKPEFEILEAVEYAYRGRYVGDTPQVFRITLQNENMPKNMFLQYFLTRQGNTLYTRDSLLTHYKSLLSRIESAPFLMDYLQEDAKRTIELFYFDDKGVNDHVIERFNTNPQEWEKYDKFNKDPKFEHLYCGCNLRLASEYIQDAMLLELTDEFGNSSIWFLLPDGTPVLHFFEGRQAYKYTYKDFGTTGVSVQYACTKFNLDGKMIRN